MFILDRHFY